MAGLQTIINHCDSISIDRRRVMGVQFTRSEIAKTSETPTRNPWRFILGITAQLDYNSNRDLLEAIDHYDRRIPQQISFNSSGPNGGASSGLSYVFQYLAGTLTTIQQSQLTVISFVGNQLTLGGLPASGVFASNTNLFNSGDLIQIQGYPYPFTVVGPANVDDISVFPGPVPRGNGASVTLTMHRPNFITDNVSGLGVNIGNNCIFNMFCQNMPTYKLLPGGRNAVIQWSSDFQLYEYTGTYPTPNNYIYKAQ